VTSVLGSLGMAVRPAQGGMRVVVLRAVGAMVLVVHAGCGNVDPTASPPENRTVECDGIEDAAEEDRVGVVDRSGAIQSCRHLSPDERAALASEFEPRMQGGMRAGDVWVGRHVDQPSRTAILWVVAGCDGTTVVTVTARDVLSIELSQERRPPCPPGTGARALELLLNPSVDALQVHTRFVYTVGS
jgi:hypothetical protein